MVTKTRFPVLFAKWLWSEESSAGITKLCTVYKILSHANFVRKLSSIGTAWIAIKGNPIRRKRENGWNKSWMLNKRMIYEKYNRLSMLILVILIICMPLKPATSLIDSFWIYKDLLLIFTRCVIVEKMRFSGMPGKRKR